MHFFFFEIGKSNGFSWNWNHFCSPNPHPKQTHLQLASSDFQQNLVMIFVLTPRLCWGLIGKHNDVTHLVFRGVCSMNVWTVSQKH